LKIPLMHVGSFASASSGAIAINYNQAAISAAQATASGDGTAASTALAATQSASGTVSDPQASSAFSFAQVLPKHPIRQTHDGNCRPLSFRQYAETHIIFLQAQAQTQGSSGPTTGAGPATVAAAPSSSPPSTVSSPPVIYLIPSQKCTLSSVNCTFPTTSLGLTFQTRGTAWSIS
jgi:hypothetical protein